MLATDEELRSMYHDHGMSLAQIGVRYGVNSEVIRYHMIRWGIPRRRSSACPGNLNGSWNGGRFLDKNGYVLVWVPDHPDARKTGYVLEHRLVMEQKLGRRLLRREVVHHEDKNKENNHPDNLHLYGENADHLRDELTGRVPAWSPDGLDRMREAGRGQASHPAWTEERRERARQRMMVRWENGGVARRKWTPEDREKQGKRARLRRRKPDGSFE